MALEGRVTVVTGATGIVGEGIARAFLEAGATVVAPIRSAGKEAALRAALGSPQPQRLITPVEDYAHPEGAKHLGVYVGVKFKDGVDHVVACTGGMVQMGLITQVTSEGFNQAMHDRVLGQVCLAQALAPLLKPEPSSSYTVITGRLGETCTMPDGALFSVCNAAVYGIVQALQAEYRSKPQRINELRIGAIVRRDSEAEHPAFPGLGRSAFQAAYGTGAAADAAASGAVAAAAVAVLSIAISGLPPAALRALPFLLPGKKAYPASMVGAKAVELAAGGQSDEIVRLYLD